jgi:hypothetical protein
MHLDRLLKAFLIYSRHAVPCPTLATVNSRAQLLSILRIHHRHHRFQPSSLRTIVVIFFKIMDDDDYGADDALLEAMAAVDSGPSASGAVKQPTPQIINKPAPSGSNNNKSSGSANPVVQPKPQIIQQKNLGSTILVSPRQRGNPVLTSIRSIPWEYSDIPADYVVGLTTCVLFLR